jgi:hypothetical protein
VTEPISPPTGLDGAPEAYTIRTEEELLRWLWQEAWGRTDTFNIDSARQQFTLMIESAVLNAHYKIRDQQPEVSSLPASGDESTDALVAQVMGYSGDSWEREELHEYLATLSIDQLVAIQRELDKVTTPSPIDYDDVETQEYINLYLMTQTLAEDDALPYNPHESYNSNLAFEDYLRENFQTTSTEQAEEYVLNLAIGLIIQLGSDYDVTIEADREAVRAQILAELAAQGIVNPTLEDLTAYVQNRVLAQIPDAPDGMTDEEAQELYLASNPDLQHLYQIAADYHAALALDQLRAIAYDPTWNPAADERLFGALGVAIAAMPREVLGVDIGFAQDGMQSYWQTAHDLHLWRLELKASLDRIEAQMLERAEGEQEPLWWLLEIPLSILVEPLDWLFTIRDVLQGDMVALVGLLPFVPSQLSDALRSIGDAGRYVHVAGKAELHRIVGQINEMDNWQPAQSNTPSTSRVIVPFDITRLGVRDFDSWGTLIGSDFLEAIELRFGRHLRDQQNEYAILFDDRGRIAFGGLGFEGTPESVPIPSRGTEDLWSIHNHPPLGYMVPSPSDLSSAIDRNMMGWAISGRNAYGEKRLIMLSRQLPEWGRIDTETLQDLAFDAFTEWDGQYRRILSSFPENPTQLSLAIRESDLQNAFRQLAQKYGFGFEVYNQFK